MGQRADAGDQVVERHGRAPGRRPLADQGLQQVDEVPGALRARMVNVVMDDYSPDDLRAIVLQKCARFLLRLSDRAVDFVVRASGGSPRSIVQILQSVEVTSASWRLNGEMDDDGCDLTGDPLSGGPPSALDSGDTGSRTLPTGLPCIPDEIVEQALTWMGLDLAGLDATGRTILSTIATHGRATAELVATVLGLDIAYARENLAELRARHLVHAAPGRGWTLTDAGTRLVKDLAPRT